MYINTLKILIMNWHIITTKAYIHTCTYNVIGSTGTCLNHVDHFKILNFECVLSICHLYYDLISDPLILTKY